MRKKPTPTDPSTTSIYCVYKKSRGEWLIEFFFGGEPIPDLLCKEELARLTKILTETVPDPEYYIDGWYLLIGVIGYYNDSLRTEVSKIGKGVNNRRSYLWYKESHPQQIEAGNAVSAAIRDGTLVRPHRCEWCGKECKPEAHHPSYAEEDWLNVVWLCKKCHGKTRGFDGYRKKARNEELIDKVGWVSNQDQRKEDE